VHRVSDRVSDRVVLSRARPQDLRRLARWAQVRGWRWAGWTQLVELLVRALQVVTLATCSSWASTGHVAALPCRGDLGVRPASDGWGDVAGTVQARVPLLEPCLAGDGGAP
jgi:hypothetical protein